MRGMSDVLRRRTGVRRRSSGAPCTPRSSSTAWGSTSSTAPRLSRTPFSLPGRLMISVRPRTTATARLSIAFGVCRMPSARIASAMPGARRSATSSVASGVTSRAARPVPPVVRMRSMPPPSHHARSVAAMRVALVGDDLVAGDFPTDSHEQLADGGAARVVAFAAAARVADGEDAGADHGAIVAAEAAVASHRRTRRVCVRMW